MEERYKLYQGDCLDIINNIEVVDCIITDIPYNISKKNNFKTMKDRTGRNGIDFGEWDKGFEEENLILKKAIAIFTPHSTNG